LGSFVLDTSISSVDLNVKSGAIISLLSKFSNSTNLSALSTEKLLDLEVIFLAIIVVVVIEVDFLGTAIKLDLKVELLGLESMSQVIHVFV